MKVKRATFEIVFPEPQPVDMPGSKLDKVYDALRLLAETGVLADYNATKFEET